MSVCRMMAVWLDDCYPKPSNVTGYIDCYLCSSLIISLVEELRSVLTLVFLKGLFLLTSS